MSGMRLTNRLLATIVALAILALGILVPVEVIRAVLHQRSWVLPWRTWTQHLQTNTWQTGWVRALLIAVAVLGLLLLFAQLKPRRPGLLPLAPLTDGVAAGTTRRSLQNALRRAATEVDGVAQATAKARRRRVSITAGSRLRDPAGLEDQVRERVGARLADLQLARAPRLKVSVRGGNR